LVFSGKVLSAIRIFPEPPTEKSEDDSGRWLGKRGLAGDQNVTLGHRGHKALAGVWDGIAIAL
jgi:hypothetical protein